MRTQDDRLEKQTESRWRLGVQQGLFVDRAYSFCIARPDRHADRPAEFRSRLEVPALDAAAGTAAGARSPDVAESTWVTALAALLPEEAIGAERLNGRWRGWKARREENRAGATGFGRDRRKSRKVSGGLALVSRRRGLGDSHVARDPCVRTRSDSRRKQETAGPGELGPESFCSRACARMEAGITASNRALGRDGDSYPETTGIALAASASRRRQRGLDRAGQRRPRGGILPRAGRLKALPGCAWDWRRTAKSVHAAVRPGSAHDTGRGA